MKHKQQIILVVAFLALTTARAQPTAAQSGGPFAITSFTVDTGGGGSPGGTFVVDATIGQYDASRASTGDSFAVLGGFWRPRSTAPLAITLASFVAASDGQRVLITWETVSEIDNAGFNLYRGRSEADPDLFLAWVPSLAPGSGQGNAYSIADTAVEPNRRYWYWLEGVSLNGATIRHGPVSVTVAVPTAVTMGEFQAGSRDEFVLEIWGLAVASLIGGGLLVRKRRSPPASRLSRT